MREFLKKVCSLSRCGRQNGEARRSDPIDLLKQSYRRLCVLARQLDDHAEKAPYPQVAARLRQMAADKRASAGRLRERIVSTGTAVDEPSRELSSARNHWERVVQDLQHQKALESGLFDQATLLADDRPELARLLTEVAASQRPHTDALLDLVARADPQAEQT